MEATNKTLLFGFLLVLHTLCSKFGSVLTFIMLHNIDETMITRILFEMTSVSLITGFETQGVSWML